MIVCFVGLPCVGKGTIAKRIHDEMLDRGRIGIVTTSDIVRRILTDDDKEKMKQGGLFPREAELRDQLYGDIEQQYAMGAQAVLLDGFPRFDDQVVWLVQTFYDRPLQIFNIVAPSDFDMLGRAAKRGRDEFDTDRNKAMARIVHQRGLFSGAERQILTYALPYSTIINDYVDRAVSEIMVRIKPLPKE
jgi:adenylate kinase family enzyme